MSFGVAINITHLKEGKNQLNLEAVERVRSTALIIHVEHVEHADKWSNVSLQLFDLFFIK